MGRLRQRSVLVVLLLIVVVNLPLAHGAWVGRQVTEDGVEVVATVTATRSSGDGGLVDFRFDEEVDPEQRVRTAAVDERTFARAEQEETVDVRVVPGDPERYRVGGEQGAGLLVVLTLFADVVLLLALALVLRRRTGPLDLVAVEDVRRARPGAGLDRVSPTEYVVTGEVCLVEADAVVLDLGDRRVRVRLAGHENPVGYEQPAQVRARVPDSAT